MFVLHKHIQKTIIRKQKFCISRNQIEKTTFFIEHTKSNFHDFFFRQTITIHNFDRQISIANDAFNQQSLRQNYRQYNESIRRIYLSNRFYFQRSYSNETNAISQRFERDKLTMIKILIRFNNVSICQIEQRFVFIQRDFNTSKCYRCDKIEHFKINCFHDQKKLEIVKKKFHFKKSTFAKNICDLYVRTCDYSS